MRSDDPEHLEADLSFGWLDGPPGDDDSILERIAAYSVVLARTLRAAGYTPRRLDVGVRRGALGTLELRIRGEVPGIPEADFVSLAQVTLRSFNVREGAVAGDISELRAELDGSALEPSATLPTSHHAAAAAAASPAPASPAAAALAATALVAAATRKCFSRLRGLRSVLPLRSAQPLSTLPLGRAFTGLALGLLLGVLGLPRFELPFVTAPQASLVAPSNEGAAPTPVAPPTSTPPTPTPPPTQTLAAVAPLPTPTSVPVAPRVLFAERFVTPLASWPNDPRATAWFADGAFHLGARQPGQFVATGVPLTEPVGNAVIAAQFHKVGGPAGGGYGLIVRDQGSPDQLDGRSQTGRYLVLEIGDRGEVGIWQRDQSRWVDVVPWVHSDAVRPGDVPNALLVTLHAGQVRFEVNGALAANITYDGIPSAGGVGIFVGGDLNEVALEWLRIESTDK